MSEREKTASRSAPSRTALPIPDRAYPGQITYDAKVIPRNRSCPTKADTTGAFAGFRSTSPMRPRTPTT